MNELERAKRKLDYLDEIRREHPSDRRIRLDWKEAQADYLRLKAEKGS